MIFRLNKDSGLTQGTAVLPIAMAKAHPTINNNDNNIHKCIGADRYAETTMTVSIC